MNRALSFLYGSVAYVLFLATFLYAIGFVTNLLVPRSVDVGPEGSAGVAILINTVLLGIFGLQHSIMARPAFKRVWTKVVPKPIERSTYVLFTCVALGLMYWQWRPITAVVWSVDVTWARMLLMGIGAAGWLLVLYFTFLIDHFDLFGMCQVYLHMKARPYTHGAFAERSIYKLVRHPLLLGFLIAFWFTPDMTAGHLLFAVVTTAYMLVAIQFEEHDLKAALGEEYTAYRKRTPMLIPRLTPHAAAQTAKGGCPMGHGRTTPSSG